MAIEVVGTTVALIPSTHLAYDAVARERRWLAHVSAPPLAIFSAQIGALLAGNGVHMVAVAEDQSVVGWCSVTRLVPPGFQHAGRLGMGILADHRGRGIGRRLAAAAIRRAGELGMERIELDVFSSNAAAVRLYGRLGFVHEGLKRQARKIDGNVDDLIMMALIFPPRGAAESPASVGAHFGDP